MDSTYPATRKVNFDSYGRNMRKTSCIVFHRKPVLLNFVNLPSIFVQDCRTRTLFPMCYFFLNSKLCSRRAITVRIQSLFANLILSFLNSKLHFQHATFIWCKTSFPIWSYNLNLKFCSRLAIIIKIRNFDSDLMLWLKFKVSFPAFC